jgi:hypothetical protein
MLGNEIYLLLKAEEGNDAILSSDYMLRDYAPELDQGYIKCIRDRHHFRLLTTFPYAHLPNLTALTST